jgi:hypothetical protein
MAYTTVNKSKDYFNTILYTGDSSSSRSITGVGFQPDFIWIKTRNVANPHLLSDAVRGTNNNLKSNSTDAASTNYSQGWVSAFGADGYTAQAGSSGDNDINGNTNTYVAWNWKANGAGSANTDGNNPNTVTVSANTTAGFSIIKYQGTDTGGQTIGHGLGVKPRVFISKNLSEADNWCLWMDTTGNGTADKRIILNSTNSDYGNYMPTFGTSTITLPSTSDNAWNGNGDNIIGYAFAEKTGYSKFGSYTGNNNADGTFIYTGFKPSFVMIKSSSDSSTWHLADDKRIGYNPLNYRLQPNNSNAEYTGSAIYSDFLSNGFKLRNTDTDSNGARTYIYMAFGQSLVGSNNVPCTAR